MTRPAKDFFRPLAVGAPEPPREIPARPSRAIHFFDPGNEKMAAKVPDMVGTVDVLLGNLEDAVKAENKETSRQGLVDIAQATANLGGTVGPTQFWTRINSLDSPWVLDDLTTLVPEIGDKLDVIMVPKVQGAEDIHYVDRLLAQLEAKAGLDRPILVHAILETARGVANIEEICAASPRMQGLSLGPADLAADRRMKTTRVGGGHPGYLVRQDPVRDDLGVPQYDAQRTSYQQDLWHYTIARMVDACAMHGIYPYYGPFGDIKDTVACEDQFRNAFLLGCVGAWSLHPAQIAIANKVFSPSVEDVAHARRVIAAMGDGTGAVMIDGKMEDDASVKQCQVMVALAEELAAIDPELKKQYDAIGGRRAAGMSDFTPLRSVLYMPSSNERALEKAKTIACDGLILDLEDAVAPDAKPAAREAAAAAAASGDYGRRTVADPRQRHRHRVARRRHRRRRQAGPAAIVVPKVDSADEVARLVDRDGEGRRARPHQALGDGRDPGRDPRRARHRAGLRAARCLRHRHQRPGQGAVRRARAGPRRRSCPACTPPCSPPAPPASRSSTASTTTSRTPRASSPSASRAARWASTARRSSTPARSRAPTPPSRRASRRSRTPAA